MVDFLDDPAAETEAPSPGVLVAARFDQAEGYRVYRSRGTRDWLLTFTVAGEGVYRSGQRVQICSAGDVAILAPGSVHDYATGAGGRWQFMWVHFVPVSEWIRHLHPLPAVWPGMLHCHIEDGYSKGRIAAAMERLIDDSGDREPRSPELALNAMEEILLLLSRKFGGDRQPMLDHRVSEVLRTLSRHMREPHTVASLAAQVNLSPSRLAHLFKRQTGDSIIETLIKLRLRQAARLLEFTAATIGEIAGEVGFHDAFYFTKQFTAYYGKSPSAFRRGQQAGNDDDKLRHS